METNNEKIHIYCLQDDVNDIESMAREMHISDDKELLARMVWDENNPDYVVATQYVYSRKKLQKKLGEFFKNKDLVRIFLTNECIAPDLNIYDYALVFSTSLRDRDRVISAPIMHAQKDYLFETENKFTFDDAKNKLNEAALGFCSFIYSNPNAHPTRDALFYKLSEYKKVDSIGMHLHNTDIQPSRYSTNWAEQSIDLKSKYKFSIAAENAVFEGYTSEKLLTSLQAHTVPIYFGDPGVVREINPKAFVNVNDYDSLDALFDRIIEIDQNDDLWSEIVSAPWQTEEQKRLSAKETEEYFSFVNHIFDQPISEAKRRPEGTWPTNCERLFTRPLPSNLSVKRVKEIIKKIPYKVANIIQK